MTAAIELRDVVKTFGSFRALDGLDLEVRPGEVHGFLGPNGAGKSVSMRTILGLLRADSGTVRVLDADPWTDAVALHRRIAFVPGDVNLWSNLTGGEVIDYFAKLRGDIDPVRRDELIERFGLDPTKRSGTYSKGNRQKVALVIAFSTDAELLLLDEPTSGLDPLMEETFRSTLADLTAEGRTTLLSSHILGEVERLCERVTIIRAGTTVRTGSLAELRAHSRTTVRARTSSPLTGLDELDGVHALRLVGDEWTVEVEPHALDTAMSRIAGAGIEAITCAPPTLEELFLSEYDARPGERPA